MEMPRIPIPNVRDQNALMDLLKDWTWLRKESLSQRINQQKARKLKIKENSSYNINVMKISEEKKKVQKKYLKQ